ncbi:hypothetical protein [Enterococcus casseliflavus]|uniref:hypothetical protein n=1 Tax=Enterococcus casseliflavus TaxID=37734 RepID=UPI0022E5EC6E|nr:hypothetical protein [Enterococcus casseliflavus]
MTTRSAKHLVVENKPPIWLRLLPEEIVRQLREMNNSTVAIAKWQKKNIQRTLFLTSLFLLSGYFIDWRITPLGFVVSVLLYRQQLQTVKRVYMQFRFERQMQFAKFARLLIPLLKQAESGINLYQIFSRVVPRLNYQVDKDLLMGLMKDLSDFPNSIQPYEDYAMAVSGSEMSILFMSTLYDLEQGAINLQVIDRLGQLASAEMMQGIDQIIAFKIKRFQLLFTKMMTSIVVLIVGFALALFLYQIGQVGFYF